MKHLVKMTILGCALLGLTTVSCKSKEEPDDPTRKQQEQATVLDHLVIEEVFYNGNWIQYTAKIGVPYQDDAYIKIHNPTQQTLYLDGLALAMTYFSSDAQLELSKDVDFRETSVGISKMVQFPGSGQEYAIAPGKSVLVAQLAIDHTKDREDGTRGCAGSFDLSKADFQWTSRARIEYDELPFNEHVPTCSVIYSEDEFFVQDNRTLDISRGRGLLALVKLGVADKKELRNAEYEWVASWNTSAGGHAHGNSNVTFLKIPNSWVIDAVNLCPKNGFKWYVASRTLDAGWTNTTDRVSKERPLGKSLIRKHDGKSIVDTNNSTLDFAEGEASVRIK